MAGRRPRSAQARAAAAGRQQPAASPAEPVEWCRGSHRACSRISTRTAPSTGGIRRRSPRSSTSTCCRISIPRIRRAARPRQALAHGDAGAAQALHQRVLPLAARQLRQRPDRLHRRPAEDLPDQCGSGCRPRHGTYGGQARQRRSRWR